MTERRSTRSLALVNWNDWERGISGWSHDTIQSANLAFISQQMERLCLTMEAFRRDMLSLGNDGLHAVIREHAKRIRKAQQRQLQRDRARRRAKRAAQKAAR